MRPKRPTSVTVIAVFHFIFGGLGFVCGMCGIVGQGVGMTGSQFGAPQGGAQTAQQKEIQDFQQRVKERTEEELPLQKTLAPVNIGLNLALSLLLLISGLGLVNMQKYGWWGSILYGILSILMQVYLLLFSALYSMPIGQRILNEELAKHPAMQGFSGIFQAVGPLAITLALLGLIYPIIVLIVMSLPRVRAAFRGEPAGAEDQGNRYDAGGREDDAGRPPPGYEQEPPPGYGGEPDDRIGPAPR
jgi:hypothetical protein